MAEVLVIGSYNRDLVLTVPRFPLPGETLSGTGMAHFHGGKGSNQAVQAARCGASVAIRACIGADAAGDAALALWEDERIATGLVQRDGMHPTGTAVILVDAAGENQIVVVAGANGALQAAEDMAGVKLVLAQIETPVAATLATFRAARAVGAVTVLNAAPAAGDLPAALFDMTDLLVVNQSEAVVLLPGEARVPADLAPLLAGRHRLGAIVTAGAAGAFWAAAGRDTMAAAAAGVAVVDTTGAGDAFCGALVASMAEGLAPDAALRRAVAAGCLACTVAGALPSLPRRDAIMSICGGA